MVAKTDQPVQKQGWDLPKGAPIVPTKLPTLAKPTGDKRWPSVQKPRQVGISTPLESAARAKRGADAGVAGMPTARQPPPGRPTGGLAAFPAQDRQFRPAYQEAPLPSGEGGEEPTEAPPPFYPGLGKDLGTMPAPLPPGWGEEDPYEPQDAGYQPEPQTQAVEEPDEWATGQGWEPNYDEQGNIVGYKKMNSLGNAYTYKTKEELQFDKEAEEEPHKKGWIKDSYGDWYDPSDKEDRRYDPKLDPFSDEYKPEMAAYVRDKNAMQEKSDAAFDDKWDAMGYESEQAKSAALRKAKAAAQRGVGT